MFDNYKDILSVKELAECLQIGKNSAYKLLNNGEIQSIKVGKVHKIPKKFLVEYILKNTIVSL